MFLIPINFEVNLFNKAIDDFYLRPKMIQIRKRSSSRSLNRAWYDLFVRANFKNPLGVDSEAAAAL